MVELSSNMWNYDGRVVSVINLMAVAFCDKIFWLFIFLQVWSIRVARDFKQFASWAA